ncbi:hypothetical protein N7510_001418 [Penicillium lagena]|uniref:uncharacterized protein n=1 Tax=Penicillium lagena TaxID=94218 RepID=UPI0025412E5F|nr:uncharacterized protein N7510_001418 [Penicillium lagena]KAJ5625109.1 hypothetical protein N7510_001418 [Penicillium lagena]
MEVVAEALIAIPPKLPGTPSECIATAHSGNCCHGLAEYPRQTCVGIVVDCRRPGRTLTTPTTLQAIYPTRQEESKVISPQVNKVQENGS